MTGRRQLVVPARVAPGRARPGRLLAVALVVGLGIVALLLAVRPSAPTAAALPTAAPGSARSEVAPLVPQRVRIPSIGVDGALSGLGRTPDGGWAVPPVTSPELASWYSEGVTPGSPGPAVILGHVSGRPDGAPRSIPGVFARLGQVQPGASVEVVGAGGRTAAFRVTRVQHVAKAAFPTAEVLGATAGPTLRLVTCGGTLRTLADGSHSYDGSVIVFADGV